MSPSSSPDRQSGQLYRDATVTSVEPDPIPEDEVTRFCAFDPPWRDGWQGAADLFLLQMPLDDDSDELLRRECAQRESNAAGRAAFIDAVYAEHERSRAGVLGVLLSARDRVEAMLRRIIPHAQCNYQERIAFRLSLEAELLNFPTNPDYADMKLAAVLSTLSERQRERIRERVMQVMNEVSPRDGSPLFEPSAERDALFRAEVTRERTHHEALTQGHSLFSALRAWVEHRGAERRASDRELLETTSALLLVMYGVRAPADDPAVRDYLLIPRAAQKRVIAALEQHIKGNITDLSMASLPFTERSLLPAPDQKS